MVAKLLIAMLLTSQPLFYQQMVRKVEQLPKDNTSTLFLRIALQHKLVFKHLQLQKPRSEEHTSELQSRFDLVCRLLLEKKKQTKNDTGESAHWPNLQ